MDREVFTGGGLEAEVLRLALCWMKYGLRLLSPRLKSSPAPGFSTFTTSAPRALSSEVA